MSSELNRREFLVAGAAFAGMASLAAEEHAPVAPWEQTTDKKVRIGVVGGGFGLSFQWNLHPNCIVEAVSDLRPERRERLMGKYECGKVYNSLEELVLDPKIDAVALFTEAPAHGRHTLLCFEHGKHVISAVPAVMTLEEAAQVKEAKERTGLKYMMAETSYYRWPTIRMRELFAAGALGEIVYCEADYYHPKIGYATDEHSVRNQERTWRWGFPPMLYPTHCTGVLVGVTRERLVKVSCVGLRDEEDPAYPDNDYKNPFVNAMAMYVTDKGHPFRCNVAWKIFADGERAQWFGTEGALFMPSSSGQPFTERFHAQRVLELPDYWPMVPDTMRKDTGHGGSHPFITNEFVMALVEDREPAIDLYESLAMTVPGIVSYESSFKDGEQLPVPQFERG